MAAFLEQAAGVPATTAAPRLLFAVDATASRQPTWDRAAHLQATMFDSAAGLAVKLLFYRGFQELKATAWVNDPARLKALMSRVTCRAGATQLARVLDHAAELGRGGDLKALVFVGDCLEEPPDAVMGAAGRLALAGVPAFLFQEGRDPVAGPLFTEIARLTGGVHHPFDGASPAHLKALLAGAAVYAAGGWQALKEWEAKTRPPLRLTSRLGGGR